MAFTPFRIGYGYDVHQLKEGFDLWIGGVLIPHEKGAVGHSDADVLLHTISDAILGAIAMGDIGHHFPDTDPSIKGIDSSIILKKCIDLAKEKGYAIGNVDSTIALQKPKVAGHIEAIRKRIAEIMACELDQVAVKATTTEKLGFVGKEEGIAAHSVVLLQKNES